MSNEVEQLKAFQRSSEFFVGSNYSGLFLT